MIHNKIFVDANILLDLFEKTRSNHQFSKNAILKLISNEKIELVISSDIITNIFFILNSRYKYPFDKTLEVIEQIDKITSIESISKSDILNAIEICKNRIFKDFEDALQYMCALKSDCTLILTNNPKDFKKCNLEINTSKEFAKK